MKKKKLNQSKGFTLVEVLVATSIILFFLLALFTVSNLYLRTVYFNTGSVKATFLAEEGLEAMRSMRDSSWGNNIATLTNGTDYYLVFSSGSWATSTNPVYIDNLFERVINIENVYRDVSDDIVSSGGVLDPDTKLISVTVSWANGTATSTKSLSTYLSNIRE